MSFYCYFVLYHCLPLSRKCYSHIYINHLTRTCVGIGLTHSFLCNYVSFTNYVIKYFGPKTSVFLVFLLVYVSLRIWV